MKKHTYLLLTLLLGITAMSCSTDNKPVYQLATSASPAEAGSVSPEAGEYDEGTEVKITANPNEHWVFAGWQGDHTGTQNPDTVVMNANQNVTALFEKKEYSLIISKEGEGTVEEEVVQSKKTDYPHGTMVQLTALPADGWRFGEWSGDADGSENPAVVEIETESAITAHFNRREFAVADNVQGEGSVNRELISGTETESGYLFESVLELTAIPEAGWEFIQWKADVQSEENPIQVTVESDINVTAVFELRAFNIDTSIEGKGTISADPERDSYTYNEEVELKADPDSGWEFIRWEGDLSGSENPATLVVDSDKSVTAVFNELCLVPKECVTTQFYASVIVGAYVFDSNLSIRNHLPGPVYLTRIRIRRGDGSFAAESDNIDRWIEPGKGLNFSAHYLPQPTTDQFQNFTARFFIEYEGKSYELTNSGSVSTLKAAYKSETAAEPSGSRPGIRLIH